MNRWRTENRAYEGHALFWRPRSLAASTQKPDRTFVEAHECVSAEPLTRVSDDSVCKIATCIEHCKPRINSRPIGRHIAGIEQFAKRTSDIGRRQSIVTGKDPDKLTQRGQCQCDELSSFQFMFGGLGLRYVIQNDGAYKHICISCDFHSWPAQPFAIASFISSIETVGPSYLNIRNASEILPVARSAVILRPPPGSFSIAIFSPGRTPRCCWNSFRNVTCPLAVSVYAFIERLPLFDIVRGKHLTVNERIPDRASLDGLSRKSVSSFCFVTAANCRVAGIMNRAIILLLSFGTVAASGHASLAANAVNSSATARRAAIHSVVDARALQWWLARVPVTKNFPPDFVDTLRGGARAFVVEMTTAPNCLPCNDLWKKLEQLNREYGVPIGVVPRQEAMVRSGRLALPWVGHPVLWVRSVDDPARMIPVAIGTDHRLNLARNVYLAFKMMTGVRPDVGVRAMSRFTGIVGASDRSTEPLGKR